MRITLDTSGNVGQALKGAREARGLTVEEIAEVTRVRPAHIVAIETFELDSLPSRPFTIGYVRAYAAALGADADGAVARFRTEAPEEDTRLRTPVGVRHQTRRRFGSIALLAVAAGLAVVGWNVVRHAMPQTGKTPEVRQVAAAGPLGAKARLIRAARTGTAVAAAANVPVGPVTLGAPLPAPPEATIPAPYDTPGLAAAAASGGSADAANAAQSQAKAAAAASPAAQVTVGEPFVPAGTVYGDAKDASGVILQARKPTALTVHGADGAVYFTRWLAAGEAWRAPTEKGLSVDTPSPEAVEAFVGGVSRGVLKQPTTALSTFGA